MSTIRPWPSSRSRPFGRGARCSRSHWQQRLLRMPRIPRALCQARPPVTHFLKQQQQHVLTTSMCSVNFWTLSEIKSLTKYWENVRRFREWLAQEPRSEGRDLIDIQPVDMDRYVVFFCWSWKSPTIQTMSWTHWQVPIGQLTVNWMTSAMVIVWLILKEFKLNKKVLESRRRDLTKTGLGNCPRVARPLRKKW